MAWCTGSLKGWWPSIYKARFARADCAVGVTRRAGRSLGFALGPRSAVDDDAAFDKFIRATTGTTYHPVGTCKMGPASDPMAVVDAGLCVHGVEGLRVADASIMLDIIGGNTSAPSMMIGERAAEFMLAGRGRLKRPGLACCGQRCVGSDMLA